MIFGFALSFTVLFHKNEQFNDCWKAIVKTVVMMMGEYDYENLFPDDTEGNKSFLTVTSRVIFLCFIILASMVLMNLMIGLAVNDIQGLQKEVYIYIFIYYIYMYIYAYIHTYIHKHTQTLTYRKGKYEATCQSKHERGGVSSFERSRISTTTTGTCDFTSALYFQGHIRRLLKQAEFVAHLEKLTSHQIFKSNWLHPWFKTIVNSRRLVTTKMLLHCRDNNLYESIRGISIELMESLFLLASRNNQRKERYVSYLCTLIGRNKKKKKTNKFV